MQQQQQQLQQVQQLQLTQQQLTQQQQSVQPQQNVQQQQAQQLFQQLLSPIPLVSPSAFEAGKPIWLAIAILLKGQSIFL
jgi:hypothetical protein